MNRLIVLSVAFCAVFLLSCSSNEDDSSGNPSSNALEITLTKYQELASLDPIGYGDPRVSFRVRAYQQRTLLNDNNAIGSTPKLLLSQNDISIWTGSLKDTVTISVNADSVIVNPIVKDNDSAIDDDYSPDGVVLRNFVNGTTHNNIEGRNSYISVIYSLRFIRR